MYKYYGRSFMLIYKDTVNSYCFWLSFMIKMEVHNYGCNVYGSKLKINFKVCGQYFRLFYV
jgi:hypothetical protein